MSFQNLAELIHYDNTLYTNDNQATIVEDELSMNNYTLEESIRMQETDSLRLYQIKKMSSSKKKKIISIRK